MARFTAEQRRMKAQELEWQAQDDARVLATVTAITNDPARLKRAKVEISKRETRIKEELEATRKAKQLGASVAKPQSKTTKKSPTKNTKKR